MAKQTIAPAKRQLRPVKSLKDSAAKTAAKSSRWGLWARLRGVKRLFGWLRWFRWVKRLGSWKPLRIAGLILLPPYLRSSWRELRLVDWPSRKESRQLTTAVLLFTLVFGLFIAVLDYGLDKLFKQVILR